MGHPGFNHLDFHPLHYRRLFQIRGVAHLLICTLQGLAVSLALFVTALNRINEQFAPASPASLGPAIWISIAAVVLIAFSGLLIASSKPAKSASDNHSMQSKGFQAVEPVTYRQQYGSYTRPTIGEPQYVHQGMKLDFDPRQREGSYYSGDSVYSGDAQEYHAASYDNQAVVGKSRSLSGSKQGSFGFKRSLSRNSGKSKR